MVPYTASFDEIRRDFLEAGIDVSAPGFYDDPTFSERESRNPDYLNTYARFVRGRQYAPGYFERAERVIRVVGEILEAELVTHRPPADDQRLDQSGANLLLFTGRCRKKTTTLQAIKSREPNFRWKPVPAKETGHDFLRERVPQSVHNRARRRALIPNLREPVRRGEEMIKTPPLHASHHLLFGAGHLQHMVSIINQCVHSLSHWWVVFWTMQRCN